MSGGFHMALRDRIAKTEGGATQLREMANIFDMIHGIPLDPKYLALQYLIGIDIIPLGRTMTLVGPKGSGKSVFGWFIGTLFADAEGFIGFVDAENKTSWDQVNGVFRAQGLNAEDWFWRLRPKDQQEMFEYTMIHGQELTQNVAKPFEGKSTTKKNSLYGAPLMYFVDSISYLASASQVKKRVEENEQGSAVGFAGAHKANKLSEHLATFTPNFVDSWPALYVAVNHQKNALDENAASSGKPSYGGPKKTEPGGEHKEFMYSLNIEFAKANGMAKHIVGVKRQGMTLTTQKSCFSDHGRKIGLVMRTTQTEDNKGISVDFDWGRAIVDLLATGNRGWGAADKSIVDAQMLAPTLQVKRDSLTKCSCKEMGMTGVSPEELGNAIIDRCREDDEFYAAIQASLWITRKKKHDRKGWKPPTDKGKMLIDDARAMMPLPGDPKKASPKKPAPKKKAAPKAQHEAAPQAVQPTQAAAPPPLSAPSPPPAPPA